MPENETVSQRKTAVFKPYMYWCTVTVLLMLFIQVRVVLKYRHCDGNLCMKVTDDSVVCMLFLALARTLFCLWSYVDHVRFTVRFFLVFTVQDWPGPRCKEDRETAWEVDEINGLQRDPQWIHGNGVNESKDLLGLDSCLWLNQTDIEERWIYRRMEMKFGWCLLTILRMFKIMLVWRASSKTRGNIQYKMLIFVFLFRRSDNVVMVIQLFQLVCLLFNVGKSGF